MKEDDVNIWGDGTFKGNDIERFYRYGLLTNPDLKIYKPGSTSNSSTSSVAARKCPNTCARPASTTRCRRKRPTPPTPTCSGATTEAKDLEHLNSGIRIVQAHHGRTATLADNVAIIKAEEVTDLHFEEGRDRPERRGIQRPGRSCCSTNRIGGRHGLGAGLTRSRTAIEAKSRGIYEAPGLALLFIAYERLVTGIHNEGYRRYAKAQTRPPAVPGPLVHSQATCCAKPPSTGWPAPSPLMPSNCAAALLTTRCSTPIAQPDLRPRAPVDGKGRERPFTPPTVRSTDHAQPRPY